MESIWNSLKISTMKKAASLLGGTGRCSPGSFEAKKGLRGWHGRRTGCEIRPLCNLFFGKSVFSEEKSVLFKKYDFKRIFSAIWNWNPLSDTKISSWSEYFVQYEDHFVPSEAISPIWIEISYLKRIYSAL